MIQQCFEWSCVYALNQEWLFLSNDWNKSFEHHKDLSLNDWREWRWSRLTWMQSKRIEKIEIEVFNWLKKTMTSFCIFSNISFLFIQSLLNITLWWSISAINIDTVNFLWLSMMRLNRILWVMIFLNIFSS